MYTQFTIAKQAIHDADLFEYDLSELPITGAEEQDEQFLLYTNTAENELELTQYLQANQINFTKENIPDTNWNALWESNFPPVVIDSFVHIRADFHEVRKHAFTHEITINPKMSFGTGHHATTRMVMQLMEHIHFLGKQVSDFGTGTGILAILASKLGAAHIDACDYDSWCIENSKENIVINNINNIHLFQADVPPHGHYDIVIANVNRNIILDHQDALANTVVGKGILLLSGILGTDIPEIEAVFTHKGFAVVNTTELGMWAALQLVKNSA
jgi:ribosomal protein L11 methyltransferase